MLKAKEKDAVESIKAMPSLWIKCPKCNEILYAKGVEETNRCPSEDCGYLFPYPVAKTLKVEALLNNPKATYGQLSKLILELLDSISSHNKKVVFLIKIIELLAQTKQ